MKHSSNKANILILLLVSPLLILSQETITLDQCFDLVSKNYPLAKQALLLNNQMALDIEAINKGKLPKLDLNAQASYQSDVTFFPGQSPNSTIEPPNKDQYRTSLDLNQIIYQGGMIAASTKVKEATYKVKQQELKVNLYALKHKVNQLFHSTLLAQEKIDLIKAKEELLKVQLKEVNAGLKYGTVLPTSADILQVELLKTKRQFAELNHAKSSLLSQLSILINKELHQDMILQEPQLLASSQPNSKRPELEVFDLQKEQIDFSSDLLSKSKLPKIYAFAQGGYGNPGLNMLDNSFNTFYMTGVRLNWNVFDWKKTQTKKKALQINKDIVNSQIETFELNIGLELKNLQSEIDQLEETMNLDHEIIALRENILKSTASQLKNGVITSSDYVTDFTHLFNAKSDLNLHRTQILLKKIQYQITKGTYGIKENK